MDSTPNSKCAFLHLKLGKKYNNNKSKCTFHTERDIELMLHENVLCDVKLRTGAETFPAHWFILSARSPVFRAMCQSDMKEKSSRLHPH
ncbi:hypothetical protein CEXT_143201 [Caerostris extrusa]|uniref:BTB domain-containing protein n=1 Tax=Caerostris extrusa TaxID=172846 RepID=A0AAV4MA85_CAEEX|nr:hypothetical protein CEXT_143201 [Caerostris extrusa]